MGFMNKIKNLFTEEIEEEEVSPIKKEIQVSIPSPAEEKVEEEEKRNIEIEVSESDAIQKEEKFVFPVFFDDKDFDTLEPPKREEEPVIKRETYGGATIDISPKKEEQHKGNLQLPNPPTNFALSLGPIWRSSIRHLNTDANSFNNSRKSTRSSDTYIKITFVLSNVYSQ